MAEHDGVLSDRGKSLEDEFFRKQDAKLIEKLRELKREEDVKAALAKAIGITDERVLARLLELGITPEIGAALSVVPLVEVAWADGTLAANERAAVLSGAEKLGLARQSVAYQLLERWLEQRPEPRLLDAWAHCVRGMREQLPPAELDVIRKRLLGVARSVAGAAGGFLGVGKISSAEEEMLRRLETAFSA